MCAYGKLEAGEGEGWRREKLFLIGFLRTIVCAWKQPTWTSVIQGSTSALSANVHSLALSSSSSSDAPSKCSPPTASEMSSSSSSSRSSLRPLLDLNYMEGVRVVEGERRE